MEEHMLTKDVIKIAKSLKRNIVEITPNYICGTDEQLASFSIVYPGNCIELDPEIYYLGSTTLLTKYDLYLLDRYKFDRCKDKIDYLMRTCLSMEANNKLLYEANDINTDPVHKIQNLNESMSMKSKDGSMMINVDYTDLIMSSCGTMHPVNKSDIMHVQIYEYDDISFLAKFTIDKKKYKIYEYARFLYLK